MMDDRTSHTMNPTMTGSTVMAVAYQGGVAIATDRSVFYGNMERLQKNTRQYRVNDHCIVSFSGDFADFQWLQNLIERKQLEIQRGDRKQYLEPKMVHSFLTALFYQRRSKLDPLWLTIVVCGMQSTEFKENEYEPFIGIVNMYGVAYTNKYVATDFGAFLLQQMIETRVKGTKDGILSKEEAIEILKLAMEITICRHSRTGKSYDITTIDVEGTKFGSPVTVTGDWTIAEKYQQGKF